MPESIKMELLTELKIQRGNKEIETWKNIEKLP